MDEALKQDINTSISFNDFFTRELKPDVRPLTTERHAIACPADGAVSQAGNITDGNIFQAKGESLHGDRLAGGSPERAEAFNNGVFSHLPVAQGLSPPAHAVNQSLREMVHIPGRLFSVNTATTHSVPGLFAGMNVSLQYLIPKTGPMALVLVGAIFVSSVETVWHGVVTPPSISSVQSWQYQVNAPTLKIGKERSGRFNMGSTIIVLFGENKVQWESELKADRIVKLGEIINHD